MRRGLAWIGGALGLAALARTLRKRQARAAAPTVADPAEELRAALDETRAEDDATAEPALDEPASLEERRRQVHERAQEALDAMRDPPPAS